MEFGDIYVLVDRARAANDIVGGIFRERLHWRSRHSLPVAVRIAGVERAVVVEYYSV